MDDYLDITYSLEIDKNNIKYLYIDTLIILGVKNRYKGQGTKELNKLIRYAIENNCEYIELKADTVQRQAKGFVLTEWYRKFGFYTVDNSSWLVVMRKNLKEIDIKWRENSKDWFESENVTVEVAKYKYALFILERGRDRRWACHKISGLMQQIYPKYTAMAPDPTNNIYGKYATLDGAKEAIQKYYNMQLR